VASSSLDPFRRREPDFERYITNARHWLAAVCLGGAQRSAMSIGARKTPPPTPVTPDTKPTAAPIMIAPHNGIGRSVPPSCASRADMQLILGKLHAQCTTPLLDDRLFRRDLHLSLQGSARRVRDNKSAHSHARARILGSGYRGSFSLIHLWLRPDGHASQFILTSGSKPRPSPRDVAKDR
jgi:hypothetical protein